MLINTWKSQNTVGDKWTVKVTEEPKLLHKVVERGMSCLEKENKKSDEKRNNSSEPTFFFTFNQWLNAIDHWPLLVFPSPAEEL